MSNLKITPLDISHQLRKRDRDSSGEDSDSSSTAKSFPNFSYPLQPQTFCDKEKTWMCIKEVKGKSCQLPTEMSFATYNVWFEEFFFQERARALFEILDEMKPKIVCLQEVTPRFLRLLSSENWCRSNYFLSDTCGDSCAPYGVVMMVSKEMKELFSGFTLHILPSKMDRSLLVAKFCATNESLVVGTLHLESLNNNHRRVVQLQKAFDVLGPQNCEHAVLCGDLNFSDDNTAHAEENETLRNQSHWVDLGENTTNSTRLQVNTTTGEKGVNFLEQHVQGRVDRILLRSSGLRLKKITYLGVNPIESGELEKREVYPSDHKGVYAVICST